MSKDAKVVADRVLEATKDLLPSLLLPWGEPLNWNAILLVSARRLLLGDDVPALVEFGVRRWQFAGPVEDVVGGLAEGMEVFLGELL
jgi:hypothetical protein